MKKYDTRDFFLRMIMEAGDEAEQTAPEQAPQPQNQEAAPQQPQGSSAEAFRTLQGQVVSGVQFSPNGSNGGVIKIKVKNSYVPFTISWVNQQVTVTTMTGEVVVLAGG